MNRSQRLRFHCSRTKQRTYPIFRSLNCNGPPSIPRNSLLWLSVALLNSLMGMGAAFPWSPRTHVLTANEVILDAQDGGICVPQVGVYSAPDGSWSEVPKRRLAPSWHPLAGGVRHRLRHPLRSPLRSPQEASGTLLPHPLRHPLALPWPACLPACLPAWRTGNSKHLWQVQLS
jgi:hypothetical protein